MENRASVCLSFFFSLLTDALTCNTWECVSENLISNAVGRWELMDQLPTLDSQFMLFVSGAFLEENDGDEEFT